MPHEPSPDRLVLGLVANDTEPDLEFKYKDQNNTPIDITGYTVTLHVKRPNDTALVKAAVMTNPSQGEFKFAWASGDLIPGIQPAEVQFIDTGGEIVTVQGFDLHVKPDIA